MPLEALGGTVTDIIGDTAEVELAGRLTPDGRPTGRLDAATAVGSVAVDAGPESWRIEGRLADAVSGAVKLERTGPGHLAGTGELRLASAQELLELVLPDSGIPLAGTASLSLDVDWPAGEPPVISGTVDDVGLELQEAPIRLLEPGRFELSGDGLEVRDLYLGHRDDRVFLRWAIGTDGSLRGNATGTLDALLLRFLVPEWEPAGRATGVVEMLGSVDAPRFEGIAEIAQGSFRLPGGQTIISSIDGTVLLSSDELVIDGSGFRFMQGRGRAGGRIASRDGAISLDLSGDIDGLRYEVFPGLVARVSGPWRLSGPVDGLHISGELEVDRTSLQRRDDPAVLIVEWFGGEEAPTPETGGPSLDLRVEADQTIELRNPFVRLLGSASLQITGTLDSPGMVGTLELEEGGEVTLQNLRYELERGTFTFSDPDRIDPNVELQLRTWVQNYQVTLRVSGTSDRLVPQVTSNPPLPTEEVYSLLAMGYRSDTLGSGAMGVGLASTMLSQQLTAELDRRTKLVLPQVRVDPFAESATGGPAARVTLVQQLAPNWTVTLQSNLSAERAEVIVSRWYLAPGIFLEASRELDGSYGIDIKMRRPY
jgi:translocation and assembly module TamB